MEVKSSHTDDRKIASILELPPPEHLMRFFPIVGTSVEALVSDVRSKIQQIIHGHDDRLLVIVGPCSIHDPVAAVEYAQRLAALRKKFASTMEVVMRVYFEKPRTTVGWKGLINDPYLDGSFRIDEGLRIARQVLIEINNAGVPAGSEFLDTISPQYIGDLIAWGAIGARTTESQVHRELASGISAPIGFKNGTDGEIKVAIDAIKAASHQHHFLSINKNGKVAIVRTQGNSDCHLILRGGNKLTNYDSKSVSVASDRLEGVGLSRGVMVDCSHANSHKSYLKQIEVVQTVADQIASGHRDIMGVMIESNIQSGSQDFEPGKVDPRNLEFGKSITDECVAWEDTSEALHELDRAVTARRELFK
jgi:3-deoxy-7-phosphoheptulonate synthase